MFWEFAPPVSAHRPNDNSSISMVYFSDSIRANAGERVLPSVAGPSEHFIPD
jgi:hypothetical protein